VAAGVARGGRRERSDAARVAYAACPSGSARGGGRRGGRGSSGVASTQSPIDGRSTRGDGGRGLKVSLRDSG
jgi:hypothetical protein